MAVCGALPRRNAQSNLNSGCSFLSDTGLKNLQELRIINYSACSRCFKNTGNRLMLYLAKETYESACEAGPATTVTAAVGLNFW